MTVSQARRIVRKKYPFAVAGYNHRPGVEGAEVRIVPNGQPIVWGQRDLDAAWLAAAARIEKETQNRPVKESAQQKP